jgi:hypothetical protein
MTFDPATLPQLASLHTAAAAAWQPTSLNLLRLAGKPYTELLRLKFTRTTACFETILAVETQLAAQIDTLNDALYAEIANHDGAAKSGLVALKRRVFNQRPPSTGDLRLLRGIGRRDLALAAIAVRRLLNRLSRATGAAQRTFAAELLEKRRLLQASAADSQFQQAVQVASHTLYTSLERYISADAAQFRSRDRKTELGAFQYLARMTSKTSPFSHFGPIALGFNDPSLPVGLAVREAAPVRHASSELRRVVVALIVSSLSLAPGIREHLPPTLNRSVYYAGDEIVFSRLRQQYEQTSHASVLLQRRGKRSALLDTVIALLKTQSYAALPELASACAAALPQLAPVSIQPTLERLVERGLIMLQLPLSSNDPAPLATLIAALQAIATPQAAECAADLHTLADLSQRFAQVSAAQRAILRQTAATTVERLLRWRPLADTDRHLVEQLFVEDTAYAGVTALVGGNIWGTLLPDIAALLECGYQRDQGGLARSWLRDAFVARFGVGGACDNLPEFVNEYSRLFGELQTQAASSRDTDPRMPRSNRIQANNRRYADFLHDALQSPQAEVVLDPAELLQLASSLGSSDEPTSVGLHLQLVADNQAALERGDVLAVLNYTLPGFGRFFARYATVLPQDTQVAEYVAQAWQPVVPADHTPLTILSVLDNNAQVHAPTTPWQLVPPDESSAAGQQLGLEQLRLEHDPRSDTLQVLGRLDGVEQPVTPLYLGSLHLTSLPVQHRLLAQLAPTVYHMEGLRPREQAHLRPAAPPTGILYTPRVRVGRLVLQRATWNIPAASLPDVAGSDDFALFFNAYRWMRQHALPEDVFVRIQRNAQSASYDPWTAHKPMAVDWSNFFSVLLFKHMLDSTVVQVSVEEMLPSPSQQSVRLADAAYVSELQVEFTRGGGR